MCRPPQYPTLAGRVAWSRAWPAGSPRLLDTGASHCPVHQMPPPWADRMTAEAPGLRHRTSRPRRAAAGSRTLRPAMCLNSCRAVVFGRCPCSFAAIPARVQVLIRPVCYHDVAVSMYSDYLRGDIWDISYQTPCIWRHGALVADDVRRGLAFSGPHHVDSIFHRSIRTGSYARISPGSCTPWNPACHGNMSARDRWREVGWDSLNRLAVATCVLADSIPVRIDARTQGQYSKLEVMRCTIWAGDRGYGIRWVSHNNSCLQQKVTRRSW